MQNSYDKSEFVAIGKRNVEININGLRLAEVTSFHLGKTLPRNGRYTTDSSIRIRKALNTFHCPLGNVLIDVSDFIK